jgi:peptidoglycan/xylan/chitin deacetylase (PgdA/CDA1 family)
VKSGLHRAALRDRGIVVAFHRVTDAIPEDSVTRSSSNFEKFCRFFKAYFDVTTLDDVITRLEQKKSIAGTLAITFDDGYEGNFEIAAPILKKLGLPATFFVVTRYIGTNTVARWDRAFSVPPRWMTWDQVRQLDQEGLQIGAHTRTHVDLGAVDGDDADCEIRGSRRDLEERLGHDVTLFAYPFGGRRNMTEANRERIRSAGFRCCVSCHGGLAWPDDDPFRLRRVPVASWFGTPEQFAFEVLLRGE